MPRRLIAAAFASLLAMPSLVAAEVVRYTDDRGVPHYVDGIEHVPEPYRARAVPLGLRNAPASAASAPVVAGQSDSAVTTIRYRPGDKIIVDAKINGGTSTRLLLDTGADRTLVSPRALTAAGVSLTRGTQPGRMQGVTGSTDVSAVSIDSLEVGNARVARLLVISHDVDQSGIDGLLGRDFLDQFRVTIDAAGGSVTLSPK